MTDDLEKLAQRSIRKLTNEKALDQIAGLIDRSLDAAFGRGADRALYLLNELSQRSLTPAQGALLHYFQANAWSLKATIAVQKGTWAWEQPDTQEEILALSRAATHAGFAALDKVRRCQILTNRANLLSSIGRVIEAIEAWDEALRLMPNFAMALGNRASGLQHYAWAVYDQGHKVQLMLHAYDGFEAANAPTAFYDSYFPPEVSEGFAARATDIAKRMSIKNARSDESLIGFPLGRSKREQGYRRWCLEQRLFLNPLNELGAHSISARDVLTLPSITEILDPEIPGDGRPPSIIGFYNQLKQEFVSARFMLFEGISGGPVHFSDRDVLLYNTLDYPCYSLGVERVRTSFRIAYSLLDKVAFFVNAHWTLGRNPDRVSFRNVWFEDTQNKAKSLHARLTDYQNPPLRSLFWLSKEVFDDEWCQTTNPDARELHDLRNHLEHKYLHVQEWSPSRSDGGGLSQSISNVALEAKALRVMKMARAALIYLSLAVHREERLRAASRPEGWIMPTKLMGWDDKWKRFY